MERCKSCGSILTFVGFDSRGRRVLTCTSNLMHKPTEDDPEAVSVPCDSTQAMYTNGLKVSQIQWWQRRK